MHGTLLCQTMQSTYFCLKRTPRTPKSRHTLASFVYPLFCVALTMLAQYPSRLLQVGLGVKTLDLIRESYVLYGVK